MICFRILWLKNGMRSVLRLADIDISLTLFQVACFKILQCYRTHRKMGYIFVFVFAAKKIHAHSKFRYMCVVCGCFLRWRKCNRGLRNAVEGHSIFKKFVRILSKKSSTKIILKITEEPMK